MKKLIAFFALVCFVASLSIGTIGCTPEKKKDADKPAADADKKDKDKDK